MALQSLKVWAKELTADPVKGNTQVRTIRDDEWVQGIGRLNNFTAQIMNSVLRLLTQHSSPVDVAVYLVSDSLVLDDQTLAMDGQAITAAEQPALHALYGDNLDDMSSLAPTGHIYVVRNQ